MVNPDQIIRTKLRLPFLREALVSRPRLTAQLAHGLRGPLTLIAAPAGFGKTTLVASAISDFGMPAAWLSLDSDDNQAQRFLSHLIASLQQIDRRIGATAVELLAAGSPTSPDALLAGLINDLDGTAGELALVLDDYQFLRSQSVHQLTAYLLNHCPTNLHLVILSRSDPPLPTARLRARGHMVELRAADLRFTTAEALQFLNGVMGLDLDEAAVETLEAKTEGWIAGLQMAALSLRQQQESASFIKEFSGTSRFILDYLFEEVLAGQPHEVQGFLLHTSILERLTAPLCEFLLSDGDLPPAIADKKLDAASVLQRLNTANLFLISLDDQREWFRYHHLFADMLRARILQQAPGLVPRLHRRAAVWLEANEFYGDAVHHLIAAGEDGRAAKLIEHHGPERLADNDPSILWLADSLPPEPILAFPKLALYQIWLLVVQGQITRAVPLLEGLSRRFADAESVSAPGWMQTFHSLVVAFLAAPAERETPDPLPDEDLLENIPDNEQFLRNAADLLYVMALARRGDRELAARAAASSIEREKERGRQTAVPTLTPFLSRIYLIQGKLHETAALCREYLDPISARDVRDYYTAGSMMIDLGEVLLEWNLLDDAEQHVREGLRLNELWQNIMTDGFGLAALSRILLAKGDFAAAVEVIKSFEARVSGPNRPREFDEDLLTLEVRAQLAAGDVESAAQWVDRILADGSFKNRRDLYRQTLARIRLAQGRFAEVEAVLAGVDPAVASGDLVSRRLEARLMLAAAISGQDRLSEALEIVTSCLETAEPEGYMRTFLDMGEPVRELLAAHVRLPDSRHQAYAHRLLDAFSPGDNDRPSLQQAGNLVEPLSERELEVLQHIAQGRTNKEIAGLLFIAPGTVKAHNASIYSKLDVANRTEAAARARKLGLLP